MKISRKTFPFHRQRCECEENVHVLGKLGGVKLVKGGETFDGKISAQVQKYFMLIKVHQRIWTYSCVDNVWM